jgi:hypothetical protein
MASFIWDTNGTNTTAITSGHESDGYPTDSIVLSSELNQIFIQISGNLAYPLTVNVPSAAVAGDSISCAANTAGTTADYGLRLPQGRTITGVRARVANTGGGVWSTNQAYAVGNRVLDVVANKIYTCTTAGTSASSGNGPSGTGTGIVDNTCVWSYVVSTGGGANGGTLKLEFLSSLAGTPSVIATSLYSTIGAGGQTLSITGLSTVVAVNTAYFARIVDVGVDSVSTIFEFEFDAS